jgi:predicted HicB family RNase H-like nuclease
MRLKMSKRKTFSVRLKPETMKAIRLLSVEKEKSLSGLLEEAILDLLKKYVANKRHTKL